MAVSNAKPGFRRKWLAFVSGAVLSALTAASLAGEPILSAIGGFLVVGEADLQPADLIHSLGSSQERIDYAVDLYQRGYARRLFITGCKRRIDEERAISLGVRPEEVLPGASRATSTYEEALELGAFLDGDGSIRSVIVVSSPYHMRRARWTFSKVLAGRVILQFAPVPFESTSLERRWWTDASSRRMVVKEYFKIVAYVVRYGLG